MPVAPGVAPALDSKAFQVAASEAVSMAASRIAARRASASHFMREVTWYYLDSIGQEYGPMKQQAMRHWLVQGRFPLGGELLVRLAEWQWHLPLCTLYPHLGVAFTTPPLWPDCPPTPSEGSGSSGRPPLLGQRPALDSGGYSDAGAYGGRRGFPQARTLSPAVRMQQSQALAGYGGSNGPMGTGVYNDANDSRTAFSPPQLGAGGTSLRGNSRGPPLPPSRNGSRPSSPAPPWAPNQAPQAQASRARLGRSQPPLRSGRSPPFMQWVQPSQQLMSYWQGQMPSSSMACYGGFASTDYSQNEAYRSPSPGRGHFRIDLGCGGSLGLMKPIVPQKRHLDSTRRFVGIVRIPKNESLPAFMESSEARQAFGTDTAVQREELGSSKDGDEVMFHVRLDEGGKPEAYGLKRLTAVDPARPAQPVAAAPALPEVAASAATTPAAEAPAATALLAAVPTPTAPAAPDLAPAAPAAAGPGATPLAAAPPVGAKASIVVATSRPTLDEASGVTTQATADESSESKGEG